MEPVSPHVAGSAHPHAESVKRRPSESPVDTVVRGSTLVVAVSIILIASFSMAPLDSLGVPIAAAKLVSEGLSWLLLATALKYRWRRNQPVLLRWDIAAPLLLLAALGCIGGILHGEGVLAGILFVRNTLSFLPLFIALQNFPLSDSARQSLGRILVVLFLIQLPVSWAKAGVVGIDESLWIGTLHNDAGELGLLLPLFAVSALLAWYLFLRLTPTVAAALLLLMVGFACFGIIAEKRAVAFVLPIWIVLAFFLYLARSRASGNNSGTGFLCGPRRLYIQFASLAAVCIFVGWASLISIPSLNPEEKVGGSFSIKHALAYAKEYLFRGYDHPLNNPTVNLAQDQGIQMGRMRVTGEALRLVASRDLSTALFGFGGSVTSPSYLLGEYRNDIMFQEFKIRGATSGAARVILETGLVGLTLMLFWFTWLGILLFRTFWQSTNTSDAAGSMGMLLIHGVFAFDFLIYSNASWTFDVLSPAYFLLLAMHLQSPLKPMEFSLVKSPASN